jgi:hypothetical protein
MRLTNDVLSSLGVQSSPSATAFVIPLNVRRTLAASSGVPPRGTEHQIPVLPEVTGQQPLTGLLEQVIPQRGDRTLGQPQRAPGFLGLSVAMGTYGSPYGDMRRYRRNHGRISVKVDVLPRQRSSLLGPDPGQQAQHTRQAASLPPRPAAS